MSRKRFGLSRAFTPASRRSSTEKLQGIFPGGHRPAAAVFFSRMFPRALYKRSDIYSPEDEMTAPRSMPIPGGLSRFLLVALTAGAMLVTGCASKYGTQTTQVNHYPDCYAPINELRQNEFVAEKSAVGGAVAGAVIGGLIGYAATGKASGAAVGAAAGGIAGGAAGGIYGQHQRNQNDSARLDEYNASLDGNIREVNKATAAAKVARQCYERQFTVAASEFKAGHITREQFNSRYLEVTQGLEEAANILGEANRNSAQVAADYNRAVDQESSRVRQSSTPAPKAQKKSAPVASASGGEAKQVADMRRKSNTMQQSVSAGQEEERLLRERLSSTHQQARDLMS
ncbi:MAG: hypothetical protein LBH65_04515 [Desulfovibrio sp.]|nr:hypothetical protein [Desulfovibrio sp.]